MNGNCLLLRGLTMTRMDWKSELPSRFVNILFSSLQSPAARFYLLLGLRPDPIDQTAMRVSPTPKAWCTHQLAICG